MPTITVGSAGLGRDYSTPQAAIDAIASATSSDLVAAGVAYVVEFYNDFEYLKSVFSSFLISGFTCDASHNITLRPAAGQGFVDHADAATNPRRYDQTKGVGFNVNSGFLDDWFYSSGTAYLVVDGIQFKQSGGSPDKIFRFDGNNPTVRNCISDFIEAANGRACYQSQQTGTAKFENCVGIHREAGSSCFGAGSGVVEWLNCTAIQAKNAGSATAFYRGYATARARNCIALGFAQFGRNPSSWLSDSDYNATDQSAVSSFTAPGANSVYSLTAADQVESLSDAAPDARPKAGNSLQFGDGSYANDPTTDIIGRPRASPRTVGAEEFVSGGGSTPFIGELTSASLSLTPQAPAQFADYAGLLTAAALALTPQGLARLSSYTAQLTTAAFTFTGRALDYVQGGALVLSTAAFSFTGQALSQAQTWAGSLTTAAFSFTAQAVDRATSWTGTLTAPIIQFTGKALTRFSDFAGQLTAVNFKLTPRFLTWDSTGFIAVVRRAGTMIRRWSGGRRKRY